MLDTLSLILIRVAAQDREAFRELFGASSAKLYGVLLRILGNRTEAEDALQEVFTRIWLRAARFDPEKGSPMGWMIAIARNHAIDIVRTRPDQKNDDRSADEVPDLSQSAEASLIARGEALRVISCLAQLEPEKAQAIKGAYLGGLSYQDLANRYNVPLNTIRTWLRRSLVALRECLAA
jgi:RNA polymerase sigma-70 factor, ECF subfamily